MTDSIEARIEFIIDKIARMAAKWAAEQVRVEMTESLLDRQCGNIFFRMLEGMPKRYILKIGRTEYRLDYSMPERP